MQTGESVEQAKVFKAHGVPQGLCANLINELKWLAFCQALYKGIEEEGWEEMYDSYKVMSWAVGVKKLQEAQEAKALWAMNAKTERKSLMIRLAKRTLGEGIKRDWNYGKNISRIQLPRWTKH